MTQLTFKYREIFFQKNYLSKKLINVDENFNKWQGKSITLYTFLIYIISVCCLIDQRFKGCLGLRTKEHKVEKEIED